MGDEHDLTGSSSHPRRTPDPASLEIGGEDWSLAPAADPVRDAWRAEIAAIGGPSPLLHFVDARATRIELSTTHPGGLARFITGATTPLSVLIRDDVALRSARVAADRIAAKGQELAQTRGIDSVHLGIGIASWTRAGERFCAPVLLRPLAIRRAGRDVELKLRGSARLNPGFARAMLEQFGITLDPRAFVALTDNEGTFKPNAVIDRLRGLTGHLPDFAVAPRLVVSTFAEVAGAMLEDAGRPVHPILDALTGDDDARAAAAAVTPVADRADPDRRDPSTDTLLLDADAEQEAVIARVAAGDSLVVRTMPGTGGTQTVVNAIGALVSANRRVLVVSPRRAALTSIAQRLSGIGLPGLGVAPDTLRRDLVTAIGRNEKARRPQLGEIDEALVRLRGVLIDYRGALSRPDPVLGTSVLDCVTELSRLALLPDPPTTTARLDRAAVEALVADRETVAETMVQAARLGEFRYGPDDSPWYRAHFATGEDAQKAHALARRLADDALPRLLVRAEQLIGSTRMRPFETIDELGVYLRLLAELRDTLDRFLPSVFDRSLSELIAATAPRRDAPAMSGGNRRRLKALAREYVRPGMHVGDLHEALTKVQQQRVLWQRYVAAGVTPEVPVGIADVRVAWQQVSQDLAELDVPLGHAEPESRFGTQPLARLGEQLRALAGESEVLDNLVERSQLLATLHHLDLEPLISDLGTRHVPEDRVAAELELAWWRSALDSLLESERALLGANTQMLERLEADFRLVDDAHASGSAQLLAWQLAERWSIGIHDFPDEATALRDALRAGPVSADELEHAAPSLSRIIAPVWLCSPYRLSDIGDATRFDTLLLVDAGTVTIAETVGAIRRARQVVAVGDPVTQTPSPFETALDVPEAQTPPVLDVDDLHARSALAQLGGVLPVLGLTRSYRAAGEDLADLVNRKFYGGRLETLPWAGSFLGHGSLALEYVDGSGLPDATTGAVESVDAEVARVVELVLEHARTRPRESLMVVSASERHAVRVQEAVLAAAAARPETVDFVFGESAEPFAVTTIERALAQSRDRVIFSLGYGRTPHGRVLSDFGALGRPGGERLLAVALTRARRSLVIVTCFRPADVEDGRMRHGAAALAEILEEIAAPDAPPVRQEADDPMLVDLARRLVARGLRVALGHRGRLGLVAANGGTCVVVDTDSALHGRSLRESLRLRPEVLRRLGWHYARVHAFELFSDPDAVADRVARVAGVEPGPRTAPIDVLG